MDESETKRRKQSPLKNMSKEQKAVMYAQMQLLRLDGMSVEQIARKFGVCYSTVLKHTTEPLDKRPDLKRSIKMYQDGMSIGAIARELKRSSNTIHDYLEKKGVEFRKKGVFADPTGGSHRGKIKALYRAGWSTKDIASDVGGQRIWVEKVVEDIKKKEGLWG